MIDHRETAADGVYHIILYNLLCFASVPVFIFCGAARKVAGINYANSITESYRVYSIYTGLNSSYLSSVYVCMCININWF